MSAMQQDMTVGKPGKIILNFTLPIFIGNVFQQFYSMADTIIVGKFVGTDALAAVGSTGTIMFLIFGFIMGMTAGLSVITAQKFGAGDMDALKKSVGSSLWLSGGMTLLLTAVFMFGMKWLLNFMHTPGDIFSDAYTYIMIICGGIAAQMLYNLLASLLRAIGNSKVPLYFLILSALLNILLDLVFIIAFHMGVSGAAWATVISQGVSGLICFYYIVKKVPILHVSRGDVRPDKFLIFTQIRIGLPMALQYSITAVGTMMVQVALNILGSGAVAAFTAANKIEQIVTQAYVAMGTTMSTYCAQNTGAGKTDRIRQGFRSISIMGCIYSVVVGIFIIAVGRYFTYLFISGNVTEIMGQVHIYLVCVALFFIPLMVVNVYRNGIQGMGYGFLPMLAGVAELTGRGVVAVIAAKQESYVGVCLASPAAWVLAGGLLLVVYFLIMQKKQSDAKRE